MEQRFYFSLEEKKQRIFSIKDIIDILNISEFRARNIASSMVKKGAVERVKPGLFSRIPANIIIDKKQFHEDAIIIASKLSNNYFISHYTASRIHGFAERYSNHVYISTITHQRNLEYHNNLIKFVKIDPKRLFGIEKINYLNDTIMVSDVERTLIDIINRPKLSGEWIEVINTIMNIQKIDQQKLIQYLLKFNNKKTARITGYLLDQIEYFDISDEFNEQIIEFSGNNKFYINKTSKSKLVKEWNLIVPIKIRKELYG